MQKDLLTTILARRSIRRYTSQPVPHELLKQVLSAGICAPSAHNSMPWKLVAVQSSEGKQKLCSALGMRFEADLRKAGMSDEEILRRTTRSSVIFSSASVLIVPFMKTEFPNNLLDSSAAIEVQLAVQSVALAAGQMLLAAHALGLGMCWFAAPLFCAQEISRACEIDSKLWQPQCLLTLGWPDETPKEKKLPMMEEMVIFR